MHPFGDSAFVPTSSLACERRAIGGLASSVSQFVFGNAPSFGGKACVMSADEATPDQHVPIDPRVALANFILHADPRLVASFSSTDELVDQMTISQSLHAEAGVTQITIHNAPGAIAESGVPAKLAYVQREGVDQVALVWSFEYEMNDNWYEAHVSADTNAEDVTTPLMVVDWQRDAPTSSASAKPSTPATDYTYRVYPWGVNDPTEGKRELLKNPAHKDASPVGWHSVPYGAGRSSGHHGSTSSATKHNEDDEALYAPGWSSDLDKGATFKDTRGNNVFAQDNPSGGTQFEVSKQHVKLESIDLTGRVRQITVHKAIMDHSILSLAGDQRRTAQVTRSSQHRTSMPRSPNCSTLVTKFTIFSTDTDSTKLAVISSKPLLLSATRYAR
ncbi:hypothetical protein EMMF5_001158 [Cystobasidiomycetes sp. EMM_F5]